MDKKIYQKETKKLIEIFKQYNPEKIILFGSAASGKFHPESDIDICLIKKYKNSILDEKRKLLDLLWKHNYDYLVDPDVRLYKPAYFNRELKKNHPFLEEINKGKIVYER
jgi:predicted nucleotidyltransferase